MISQFKRKIMRASRDQKLAAFYKHYNQSMTVLDAGVSAEPDTSEPLKNHFLKTFRFAPECYTGLGVQDLSEMSATYPGKAFVQYSGGRFPFRNQQFDWVFSNAVIEHVGDDAAQLLFLNEMLRVGKRVFFTTPNKYFPVEAHTNLVFIHWHNGLFYWWCSRTGQYVRKHNLYLFSFHRLRRLLQSSNAKHFEVQRNRVLGATMTFTVVCDGS